MSQAPLRPEAARRKQLRQQRRSEQLRNLWRLIVFTAVSGGLAYGLLRQGWILNGPDQVEVVGSHQVGIDQVIQAADLHFPQPLLGLQPKQIATAIAAALPVEQVQVTRLMAPPRLRVAMVDREAVARAERQTAAGVEQGYVDRLGNWMTSRQGQGSRVHAPDQLQVRGWQQRLRPALAQLLEQRASLGPTLQEIRFEPGGIIWLKSANLGEVRLGPIDGQLGRRLEVLSQLGRQLPAKVKGQKVVSVDLSDPAQPELGLPASQGNGSGNSSASGSNKPAHSRD